MVRRCAPSGDFVLKTFLVGLVLGILLVPAAAYLYLTAGHPPVATTDPDMPFEKMLVRKALGARIEKEMPKSVPIPANETNYLAGAQIYKDHCAVCHGLPAQDKTTIAAGMYPPPPQLFKGKGVTDDEPGESYWKVLNGIRLTGMPGYKSTLNETQMWQVSLLLANAGKIPDSVKSALAPAPPAPSAAAMPVKKK
jgi:mono/diheme cytochrome c family protein